MDWSGILSFLFKFDKYNLAIAYLLTFLTFYLGLVPVLNHSLINGHLSLFFSGLAIIAFWLVIIRCVSWIISIISNWCEEKRKIDIELENKKAQEERLQQKQKERETEDIHNLWDWMDSINNQAHELVLALFLKNNRPFLLHGLDDYPELFEALLECHPCRDNERVNIFKSENPNLNPKLIIYEYQLNETKFELLKKSYLEYGKISKRNSEKKLLEDNKNVLDEFYRQQK